MKDGLDGHGSGHPGSIDGGGGEGGRRMEGITGKGTGERSVARTTRLARDAELIAPTVAVNGSVHFVPTRDQ